MFDPTAPPPTATCPFCMISSVYEPFDPLNPPPSTSSLINPELVSPASFIVLSTPVLVAFLDILPLSRGHLLLCTRPHRPKLSDVTASESHMHFHIIPRPEIRASGRFSESFTMFGRGKREELDDDEAVILAEEFRQSIAAVMREEEDESQNEEKAKL
jgi:diadenosine tetraphosphate (Ap4A) HIT family hydrolase